MVLANEELHFLRSLGRALFALTGSALILLAGFCTWHSWSASHTPGAAGGLGIPGSEFQTVLGTTKTRGDTLVLDSFAAEGALVSHHLTLQAANYTQLRYQIEGLQPGIKAQFFWRTAETGGQMFAAPMPSGGDGMATINLAAHPGWQGTITDIALYITGGLRGGELIIAGVSLEPYSWRGLLASMLVEWTAFRGWNPASINFLAGSPAAPYAETLSPTVAMAAWAGLALVLLRGFRSRSTGRELSYCAALLIPWLALDQLWQHELGSQLAETKYQFAGKTSQEKHLADLDNGIYRYARRLKKDVLPSSPARIFLLHDSSGHNVDRLKTQYYLLPHNIFNFGRTPLRSRLHEGDFILVLGAVPDLRFDAGRRQLVWPKGSVAANLVDSDPRGALFRVSSTPAAARSRDQRREHSDG